MIASLKVCTASCQRLAGSCFGHSRGQPLMPSKPGRAPGSPEATTTIDGRHLPPPPATFESEVDLNAEHPAWQARVVPPERAPNILLVLLDNAGHGAVSTLVLPGVLAGVRVRREGVSSYWLSRPYRGFLSLDAMFWPRTIPHAIAVGETFASGAGDAGVRRSSDRFKYAA
jgi:hypothetical protein